ncbi:TetR/AcrR family transcriptional regulator [Actinomadura kijaniata]|uniref:TetR/AcrR family transcriptional regulator n=1 Tax=Actinomadura kijaniata TaxID=46161 RepID=UPI003F1BB029
MSTPAPAPVPAVDRLLDDGTGRRPRADARRNVERLVAAARAVATERGAEVTAHEIARRAGVGVGTFYRRVGTLERLLQAVMEEILGEILARADRALADPDPWTGLRDFALAYLRLRNELCDINEAVGGLLDHSRAELRDRVRLLVERAQDAGAMRADVSWTDVAFLLVGAATGEHTLGVFAGPEQWERNLRVVLDGLRAPGPEPLPGSPPKAP